MGIFSFFKTKKYLPWSIFGTAGIVGSVYAQVSLDVEINKWFGTFYNKLQYILMNPGTVDVSSFNSDLFSFAYIAGIWMLLVVATDFFISHWVFRWRKSMTEYFQEKFSSIRGIEGSSQRIQEDTLKFARMMETLGTGVLQSGMTLFAFLPLLYTLSHSVPSIPIFGDMAGSLIFLALLTALGGTAVLALVGIKLPGIEYDIQKEEAAYRKELVLGEDAEERAKLPILQDLFQNIQKISFKSYLHYMYFNTVRYSYLQGMVIVPYLFLGPSIVAGALTLGALQQIIRAFSKVAESLQFLVRSWSTIVEFMSVYKRLREFERKLNEETKL